MNLFLRVFEHLLPNAPAWSLKLAGVLRSIFEGLTGLPDDVRIMFARIWLELLPPDTTELDQWEGQFALPASSLTEAAKRTRLTATWAALGGQSPRYLQDVIRGNGFDVYVHDWWVLPIGTPPVAHDPQALLSASGGSFTILCDAPLAECGEVLAVSGQSSASLGYPLVNKIATSVTTFLGAGDPELECDEVLALCGEELETIFGAVSYPVPSDPLLWPNFIYFGAAVFPDMAVVEAARRDEFENLLLKLCPGHLWIGVRVFYA